MLKIQRLGFGGQALAGIILEFSAFFAVDHHATLGAKVMLIVKPGAVLAIFAMLGHFLAEEHVLHLPLFCWYYTTVAGKNLLLFLDFLKIRANTTKNIAKNRGQR